MAKRNFQEVPLRAHGFGFVIIGSIYEIIKAGQGKQFRFVDKVDAAESIYVRASKDSELGKAPWLIAMSCWHTDMYWQFINIL